MLVSGRGARGDTNVLNSDAACRNAKSKAKPQKLTVGEGLHLLVNPDGRKYWRMAYRWHGKQRTLALGVYPTVGLATAKAARDFARKELASGIDPSAAKQQRARDSAEAADDTFEARARAWLEKRAKGLNEKYAAQVERRLEADVFPQIGGRPIRDVEAPEILAALRKVEKRGAIESARRLRQVIGQVFRFAIAEGGSVKRDPSADLKGALERVVTEHHKKMPLSELPGFLRSIENYDGERQTALGLKLVVLTFLRTTELRAGRWSEFENLDSAGSLWRIPADRMKKRREHIVPLSRQAVDVLHELRSLSGDSEFAFPSPGAEKFMSNNTLLFALYRLGFHGRATTHGFRGVASTVLHESGFNSDWIEMQLAHVDRDKTRAAYNAAKYLPERRRMMQWWADHLDALRDEKKVVRFRGRQ
jgi:integrase